MITAHAYPRAALIGNPSDGYFGKTISFVFRDFQAQVELRKSAILEIVPGNRDRNSFLFVGELLQEIDEFGYYGGVRLLKAAIKVFHRYCAEQKPEIGSSNFSISYSSNIPHHLGLAGSSAIVTAAFKAMMQFYAIDIPKPVLANLVLSAEKDELKIGAGLQDRVAQAYGCPVFMDFSKEIMDKQGYGNYMPFDKSLLPPLYIAYRNNLSEGSEITHNNLAARYAAGDAHVLDAMQQWALLTEQAWAKLQKGDKDIATLLNRNFDLRKSTIAISSGNQQLIDTARSVGASAKFTGSGGAIIGTYAGSEMFDKLTEAMKKIDAVVIKPDIA